jgi:subtilisin family serine protease
MKKLILIGLLFFGTFQSICAKQWLVSFKNQINFSDFNNRMNSIHANSDLRAKNLLQESLKLKQEEQLRWNDFVDSKNWGSQYQLIHFFYIVNAVWIDVPEEAWKDIIFNPNVSEVIDPASLKLGLQPELMASSSNTAVESVNGIEPGLWAVGAPFMWNLGYTGRQRKALVYDTGIIEDHPAIKSRFLARYFPYSYAWKSSDLKFPGDKSNTHGTHVSGTISGSDPATHDTIGLALNAYVMVTDPIVSDLADVKDWPYIMVGYEWAINPDGDTATVNDIPDAINNSWGRSGLPDSAFCGMALLRQTFQYVEAAGIANIYSAGNNGPNAGTVGAPQEIVIDKTLPFTVGALDANTSGYPIANFSSHGPTGCSLLSTDSSLLIRPEVSAPGVSVRSSIGHNQYANYNGTSMASPHVTGSVLLLKEAFPNATGKQILEALYYSAIDLGVTGEDNTYGNGVINIPAAYQFLSNSFTPTPPLPRNYDISLYQINGVPATHTLICNPIISGASASLKNIGDSSINVTQLEVWNRNQKVAQTNINQWVQPNQTITANIPNVTANFGLNEFVVVVKTSQQEWDTINNQMVFRVHYIRTNSIPFKEDFEGKNIYLSENSYVKNPDRDLSWDTTTVGGCPKGTKAAWVRNNKYVSGAGQFDGLVVSQISMPTSGPVYLYFRYSYRYGIPSKSDSLRVKFSDDCGTTWKYLFFDNGGIPLSVGRGGNYKPDSVQHWRDTLLDISSMAGKGSVLMMFENKCNQMGNMFIDDITLDSKLIASVPVSEKPIWNVYPNPANDLINISGSGSFQYEWTDIHGRILKYGNVFQDHTSVETQTLPNGIYFLKLKNNSGTSVHKMVVKH